MSSPIKYYPAICEPTVYPASEFYPHKDAELLHKAMESDNLDENVIINILGRRNIEQRLQIASAYNTANSNELLLNVLQLKLRGSLRDAIVALMMETTEFYARELNKYITNADGKPIKNLSLLIEALATLSSDAIERIEALSLNIFGYSLSKDLNIEPKLRKFVVLLLYGKRRETRKFNKFDVSQYAIYLCKHADAILGSHQGMLNTILSCCSYKELQFVCEIFPDYANRDIEDLFNVSNDTIRSIYLTFIKCCKCKNDYFAERLWCAIKEESNARFVDLTRIIVGRSEIDLGDIKNAFLINYGITLGECIAKYTSGSYKQLLLILLAE